MEAATNGERIRSMDDDSLSGFLMDVKLGGRGTVNGAWKDYKDYKGWLGELVDPSVAEKLRKEKQ